MKIKRFLQKTLNENRLNQNFPEQIVQNIFKLQ